MRKITTGNQELRQLQDSVETEFAALYSNIHKYELGQPVVDRSSSVNARLGDFTVCDTSQGNVTVNLPSISANECGGKITIKNISTNATNTITIRPANAETIDGEASKVISGAGRWIVLIAIARGQWACLDGSSYPGDSAGEYVEIMRMSPTDTRTCSVGTFENIHSEIHSHFTITNTGTYDLSCSVSCYTPTANQYCFVRYRLVFDTTLIVGYDDHSWEIECLTTHQAHYRTFYAPVELSAGSHTVYAQWRIAAGTAMAAMGTSDSLHIVGRRI